MINYLLYRDSNCVWIKCHHSLYMHIYAFSTSMLVTSETQAASYLYTCASTQMTLDNTTLLASGSAGVSVTVKGMQIK